MQKITPSLWFDDHAEEAANFYVSVFKDARINNITHYGNEGTGTTGKQAGSVMTVEFEIGGQQYVALNGGPQFTFNESVSFIINCEDQEEVDYFWSRLSDGGQEGACGWLKDKYGLSWQVIPTVLNELLQDADQTKSDGVTKAMLGMKKLDISELIQASEG